MPATALTLDAQQVSRELTQHAAARPLRQQLSTLHRQLQPLFLRLRQLQSAENASQQEKRSLKPRYNSVVRRGRKNQQLSDVKAICELEARIAGLEAERARLQPGAPCPLCGSEHHPAVAEYRRWYPASTKLAATRWSVTCDSWRKKARSCAASLKRCLNNSKRR